MRVVWLVLCRELGAYFRSYMGYVILAVVLLVDGRAKGVRAPDPVHGDAPSAGDYADDLVAGEITGYRHRANDPDGLGHDLIRDIIQDRSGQIWIGTYGGGVNRFDTRTETFKTQRLGVADIPRGMPGMPKRD